MTPAETFNEYQRAHWNGETGEYWALHYDRLDRTLAPIIGPLMEFAAVKAGSTVLDVGCGCGVTTIELARRVGALGKVVGIDISEPMLALAERRLSEFPNASCLLGDAAQLPLRDLRAELVVSRFGVMFFGDPAAAFANLRSGMVPGGRLRFVCWRPIRENPWLNVPLQAVCQHVPPLPKPDPEEPGPFAFADTARVTRILTAAGFTAPAFTPLEVELDLSSGGSFQDAVDQAAGLGPAKRALADQTEDVRAKAIDSIRKALEPYASRAGVKLQGAVWLVSAESAA